MTLAHRLTRNPSVPYVLPFAVFMALLAMQHALNLPAAVDGVLRVVILTAVLVIFSREVIDLHATALFASALLGIAVFVIWILPDALFSSYRQFWIFQNPLTGALASSLTVQEHNDPLVLTLRTLRSVVLVPIIEELFWRGWLMRWLISPRFDRIRLGTFQTQSFVITAILFASEHGPYWDVGLVAGLIYNWWILRTRSLGDCILAHAVTNGCLAGYVLATHRWEYWL